MKVGTKILLITLGAIACLVLAFFSVASILLVDSFDKLESNNMSYNTEQAKNLIGNELLSLRSNTLSYANWDETYRFVIGSNPSYYNVVFPVSTFQTLGINAVIIVNNTYSPIAWLYYDGGSGLQKFPTAFFAHLNGTASDLLRQGMSNGVDGVIMVEGAPYLISAQPIRQSLSLGTGAGNPMGVFILAKKIDSTLEHQLSAQMGTHNGLSMSIINYGDPIDGFGTSSDYESDLLSQPTVVKIMGEQNITGLSVYNDIYNKPALVIRVDAPRPLYSQALASENSLLISLSLLSIILFIVTVLLLQFFITSKIDRLNDGVRKIEDSGGGSERLVVRTNDELGSLAASINRMVGSLESSKRDLLESERRYKAVVEDQTELVFRSTPQGTITFANAAFLRYYGLENAPSGKLPEDNEKYSVPHLGAGFLPVPPSDVALVQSKINGLTASDPVFEHEHEILTSDQETRWFQWTVRGIFSEESELVEIQWVGRDVTDRIRLLDRLNKIDKIESLGVFAGGIAHDFNNYLTSIMGTLALMKKSISKTDPRHRRLEEAERSVMKATELTKQLLTFSKGGEPIRRTVSLPELVRETAEFGLRGSDITVSLNFADDLACVEADEGQLFQVLSNLIINAKQAMPKGGNIDIQAKNVVLEEGSLVPLPVGKYVMITVTDQGIGIPKEIIGKIFDPFFTTKKGGTGLGLTIVHSIVVKHDGFIDVSSEEGVGTTFTIHLPASEAKIESGLPFEEVNEIASGKILLMDDEEAILEVGSELLTMNGYSVECAVNGEEAIALYRKAKENSVPFDVIIMDLTIRGGTGGKETIKVLREYDPNIRAIVSSGYSTDPVMAKPRDYGFLGVVQKPYVIKDMLNEVRKLMNIPSETALPQSTGDDHETAKGESK